jgi:hypothetical protein
LSLPRRRESSDVKSFWIPVFTGMTFLEVAHTLILFFYFAIVYYFHGEELFFSFALSSKTVMRLQGGRSW